jgi:hypothetical protein
LNNSNGNFFHEKTFSHSSGSLSITPQANNPKLQVSKVRDHDYKMYTQQIGECNEAASNYSINSTSYGNTKSKQNIYFELPLA